MTMHFEQMPRLRIVGALPHVFKVRTASALPLSFMSETVLGCKQNILQDAKCLSSGNKADEACN
jgi:hypothetical protein